jgi:hypothetical protein
MSFPATLIASDDRRLCLPALPATEFNERPAAIGTLLAFSGKQILDTKCELLFALSEIR